MRHPRIDFSIQAGMALAIALCLLFALPAGAQNTATVWVNIAKVGPRIPAQALGVNTTNGDDLLLDPALPPLLQAIGSPIIRYPGGMVSELYHWQTNSLTPGVATIPGLPPDIRHDILTGTDPDDSFDNFMHVVRSLGSSAMITVNYGTNAAGTGGGDPDEAAAWVNYANNVKHYGIKYWEIGGEIFGNGEYPPLTWIPDLHADHSPTAYGKNCAEYIRAMKAKDPNISVGVDLVPAGYMIDSMKPDWNTDVLAQCGPEIGFVVLHWYPENPGQESDPFLLGCPSQIPGIVAKVRALIKQYCGANAPNVQICVTETNSPSLNPGKQTLSQVNALFLADDITTWFENGAANVDWESLHSGYNISTSNNSPDLYGDAKYGDCGLLAAGGGPEPVPETPYVTYPAFQMLSYVERAGDWPVASRSSNSLLTVHAVKQANGDLAVLLINKSPTSACRAKVSLAGFRPGGIATVYSLLANPEPYGQTLDRSRMPVGTSLDVAVPPYALMAFLIPPARPAHPSFIGTASRTCFWAPAGKTVQIGAKLVDIGAEASGATVRLAVRDAGGRLVASRSFANQRFATGIAEDYALPWVAAKRSGVYHVELAATGGGSRTLYRNPVLAVVEDTGGDPAQYNFELNQQAWQESGGMITGIERSTAEAFAGACSLGVHIHATGTGGQNVFVIGPAVRAGQTITLHVWVPPGCALDGIEPYVQDETWKWSGGKWQSVSTMKTGAWNTLAVTVPRDAKMPIGCVGVLFQAGRPWTGTCYIDSVAW